MNPYTTGVIMPVMPRETDFNHAFKTKGAKLSDTKDRMHGIPYTAAIRFTLPVLSHPEQQAYQPMAHGWYSSTPFARFLEGYKKQ